MNRTRSIRLPEGIKSFSQGVQKSTAKTAVQAKYWNQLLEELQKIRAAREKDRDEIRFLKEKIATLEATVTGQGKEIASQKTKIAVLEMAVAGQDKKIVILGTDQDQGRKEAISLKEKVAALETTHDKDIERIALEAAYDRQRVTKLEQKEPQPMQKDRGDILRSLIATNGGKMLAKYARLKMHLDKATFSRLLNTLSDHVSRKVHQPDRRQKLLILNNS
jgi:chromosome segregation ATPase